MPRKKAEPTALKSKVNIGLVLDESGSMSSCWQATINGFNEYIQDQRKETDKADITFSLTKFHSVVNLLFAGKSIDSVPKLDMRNYTPQGMTRLNDAIAQTIYALDAIESGSETKNKNLIVIFTDGEENASQLWDKTRLKQLIQDREGRGNWTFVYVGANQDSVFNAQTIGIPASNALNYSVGTTQVAARGLSIGTQSLIRQTNTLSTTNYSLGNTTAEALAAVTLDDLGNVVSNSTGTTTGTKKKRTTKASK